MSPSSSSVFSSSRAPIPTGPNDAATTRSPNRIVHPPRERLADCPLERKEHLLDEEQRAGSEQRVSQRAPFRGVEPRVDGGRHASHDRARRDDERDRYQPADDLEARRRRRQRLAGARQKADDPQARGGTCAEVRQIFITNGSCTSSESSVQTLFVWR